MTQNEFSPYIRLATPSLIKHQMIIGERIIFDYELLYVEDGQVNAKIDGKNYACTPGNVILLRPGIPHKLEFIGKEFVSQPHIHFDTVYDNLSEKIYVSFHRSIDEVPTNEKCFLRKDNIPDFPSPIIKVSDKKFFDKLFFSIIECFQQKGDWYALDCKIKMLELLKMLISDNANASDYETKLTINRNDISSIKNYIDSNYKNIITLETLEKQFHYDRFYISKMFKNNYGISIMKYYDNLRINAAKMYLKNGLSVSQITEELNAGSIYSFSRFFKNKTGLSPSEFKRTDT